MTTTSPPEGLDPEDLRLFLEEGAAHVQALENGLLALEDGLEDGSPDPELVNELFRAAHSVKGGAGLLGLRPVQDLTHHLEDLLGRMRDGRLEAVPHVVDALFEAVDVLGAQMQEAEVSGQVSLDPADTIATLVEALREADAARPVSEAGVRIQLPLSAAVEAQLDAAGHTALQRAVDERRWVYEVALALEGCRWDDDRLDHRALEALFGLAAPVVLLHEPPPASGDPAGFTLLGVALVTSSAEPALLRMLVPLPADAFRVVHDPEAAPAPAEPATAPAEAVEAVVPTAPGPSAPPTGGSGRPAAKGTEGRRKASSSIRVDVERLDDLMNVVGEIVIGQTRLRQLGERLAVHHEHDPDVHQLGEGLSHLSRMVDELYRAVIGARLIPVERVFSRFPRLVRDLSHTLGKEVHLEISGQDTEIDKSVSEELEDPLVHLLRNALDHGVEPPEVRVAAGKPRHGTVHLSAHREGNAIVIKVQDDGGGIDPARILAKARALGLASPEIAYSDLEVLQFIFAPGFSTAEKVTDVSGRGVGMDVVNANIRRLKGAIQVVSRPGLGTTFIIKLPLTLAITQALLVGAGSETFAIPLEAVRESIRLAPASIRTLNGRPVVQLRQEVIPLFSITDAFGLGTPAPAGRHLPVVVVGGAKKRLGLVVDRLEGEQNIVIKSMGPYLGDVRGVAGATILGDGRVALILDVATLIDHSDGRARHEAGAYHAG